MAQPLAQGLAGMGGAIVSACPVFRAGLRELLLATNPKPNFQEFSSIPSSSELALENHVRIRWGLLADTGRPDQPFSDWAGIKRLLEVNVAVVAMVSAFDLPPTAQLFRAGVKEILRLDATHLQIVQAIHRAMNSKVQQNLQVRESVRSTLSPGERAVAIGIVNGVSLKEIATRSGISAKTVSTYKARIMAKLNVESNSELSATLSAMLPWLLGSEVEEAAGGGGGVIARVADRPHRRPRRGSL